MNFRLKFIFRFCPMPAKRHSNPSRTPVKSPASQQKRPPECGHRTFSLLSAANSPGKHQKTSAALGFETLPRPYSDLTLSRARHGTRQVLSRMPAQREHPYSRRFGLWESRSPSAFCPIQHGLQSAKPLGLWSGGFFRQLCNAVPCRVRDRRRNFEPTHAGLEIANSFPNE